MDNDDFGIHPDGRQDNTGTTPHGEGAEGARPAQADQSLPIEELATIFELYTEWFGQVFMNTVYPNQGVTQPIIPSKKLRDWAVRVRMANPALKHALTRLIETNAELLENVAKLTHAMQGGASPDQHVVQKFVDVYDEFIGRLSRFQSDMWVENFGFDAATGLRSASSLMPDLLKERDRQSRKEVPFSFALCVVDDFREMTESLDEENAQKILKQAAKHLRGTLRSFDDAYFVQDHMFAVIFKQADIKGADLAVTRIQDDLGAKTVGEDVLPESQALSFSAIIAEPLQSDDLDKLIFEMQQDLLKQAKTGRGLMIEYSDLSPIQKMMRSGDE